MEQIRVKSGIHYRQADISVRADGDGGTNTYEFDFSSEVPVDGRWMWVEDQERYVYGTEVLLHGKANVDLSFIGSGRAPFLRDHNWTRQAGVIEGVELDESRKVLRVNNLKFSRSQDGQDLQGDIDDGIRKNVSVGYIIEEVVEAEPPQRDTPGVYHVTKWKPYEVSSVSIPADEGVGFRQRSDDMHFETVVFRSKQQSNNNKEEEREMVPENNNTGDRGNQNPATNQPEILVAERETDFDSILGVAKLNAKRFPDGLDLANEAVAKGEKFASFIPRYMEALKEESERQATVKLDLSKNEKTRFSLLSVVRQMSEGVTADNIKGFEKEVSDEYIKSRGYEPQHGGFVVPYEAIPLKRAAIISTTTGAGAVEEIHSGEVIEFLRDEATITRAGARMISGLVGKFDMARIGVGTSAYWVDEVAESGSDITTSAMDIDLLQFTPNTLGVDQALTRRMLNQTSLDVEAIVRQDMFAELADAIDLAGLAGTGASNQPTGIMYTSGVNTEEIATEATPAWSDIVNMETAVAEDKALKGSLAYVAHPTAIGNMKQTLKASGVPGFIAEDGQTNGYTLFSTSNALKGAVKSIIFGNFNELMIGMWGGIELVVNPYLYAKKGITVLTAFQDIDVQLRHPVSFCYNTVA
ncbi:phage major capsid protein [Prosthecochloris sp.]|uniref:phage major capsid protein n=1 Tax=Prosthecochloris sp. TaxID=290513 RepID=UPI0025FA0C01|nr:phage major capsid protein [Prosthecochloris sp.]